MLSPVAARGQVRSGGGSAGVPGASAPGSDDLTGDAAGLASDGRKTRGWRRGLRAAGAVHYWGIGGVGRAHGLYRAGGLLARLWHKRSKPRWRHMSIDSDQSIFRRSAGFQTAVSPISN